MTALADMRRFAALLILGLWLLAGAMATAHVHEPTHQTHACGCAHHHPGHDEQGPQDRPGNDEDEAPCGICVAVHHVPFIAFAAPETIEEIGDVAVWISPWIDLVPEEVFFDRPLAR